MYFFSFGTKQLDRYDALCRHIITENKITFSLSTFISMRLTSHNTQNYSCCLILPWFQSVEWLLISLQLKLIFKMFCWYEMQNDKRHEKDQWKTYFSDISWLIEIDAIPHLLPNWAFAYHIRKLRQHSRFVIHKECFTWNISNQPLPPRVPKVNSSWFARWCNVSNGGLCLSIAKNAMRFPL